MQRRQGLEKEEFKLTSEGLKLRVSITLPESGSKPFPSVQIHHAGGGFEPIYEEMAEDLANKGIVGITMIHRGYPGSEGDMEYGKGEIIDIGNLTKELLSKDYIDPEQMFIMGYSRGAHNAILAVEKYDYFKAAALWSTPVDMFDHVEVNPWIAYMLGGSAEEVPEEYKIRSSINYVQQIDCPLLLVHGEIDDVVPVRHTLELANALDRYNKPYEIKIYPQEGHIWSPNVFAENWRLTCDFFKRHLMDNVS